MAPSVWDIIVMVVVIPLVIACIVAFFASWWKIFEKGGEEGWAAIVPFYNAYILGKVAGGVSFGIGFLVVVIIEFFGEIIGLILWFATDEEMAYNIIYFLFATPYLIMRLVLAFKLGGKFGCGVGIRVLLCIPFLNVIPFLYLAFSKNCIYSEKPTEVSVRLFVELIILIPFLFILICVTLAVAVPRLTADRTDAQVATARSDIASAQKAMKAKVFADNINVNNPKAPNGVEWGEWIIEVAGLNRDRWQSFGALGVVPINDKENKLCYNKSGTPLLWINPRTGELHFNPSKLSSNYGKKKGFCENLRDSYVSDNGNGDRVVELGSDF